MGTIFTLTPALKAVITTALDDLIIELGKNCRLVYPPRMVACNNCVYDPVGNKSSNFWLSGGPLPFSSGSTCPFCDGAGRRAEEVTEDVVMLCAWEPRKFFYPVKHRDIRAPFSILQTKGYIQPDLAKVLRSEHLVFQTGIEGLLRKKFKLMGQPGDQSNIIQGRYFIATWEQVKQ